MKYLVYKIITPLGYPAEIWTNGEPDKVTYEKLFEDEPTRLMMIEKTGAKVLKDVPQANQATPQATSAPQTIPVCGIHNIPMVWKTGISKATGKPYAFWACSGKMPDGGWCTFKVAK
jgi:hypothetical protein